MILSTLHNGIAEKANFKISSTALKQYTTNVTTLST